MTRSGLFLFGAVASALIAAYGIPIRNPRSVRMRRAVLCFCAAVRLGDDILDAVGSHVNSAELRALSDAAEAKHGFVEIESTAFLEAGVQSLTLSTLPTWHLSLPGNRIDWVRRFVELLHRELDAAFQSGGCAQALACFRQAYNTSFRSYVWERAAGSLPTVKEYDRLVDAKSSQIIRSLVDVAHHVDSPRARSLAATSEFFSAFARVLALVDDLFDVAQDMDRQPNYLWVVAHECHSEEHARMREVCAASTNLSPWRRIMSLCRSAPRTTDRWWHAYRHYRSASRANAPILFPLIELPFLGKFAKRLLRPF